MSDNLYADVERARLAKELLDNPLLSEAFTVIEKRYTDRWKKRFVGADRASLPEEREYCWMVIQCMSEFRQQLVSVVDSGKMAETQILAEEEAQKRKKIFGIL